MLLYYFEILILILHLLGAELHAVGRDKSGSPWVEWGDNLGFCAAPASHTPLRTVGGPIPLGLVTSPLSLYNTLTQT